MNNCHDQKIISLGKRFAPDWWDDMANEKDQLGESQEECNPEIRKCLLKHMNQDTAALAFIASYNPAKVTPTKVAFPQIGFIEELGIEDAITKIKENNIDKLFLLINSFGGDVSSSYKIAQAIRENFSEITVFVPQIAASGGTLIALTGNKIVMGDMSNISPIDAQIERNGERYSVNSMIRVFKTLNNWFSKVSEEDAPYPWKALANKLDPVEFQEWVDSSRLMRQHATEILGHDKSSMKDKAKEIVEMLNQNYPVHQYTITYKEAKSILGENVCYKNSCDEYKELWKPMKSWLRENLYRESGTHIIRYILPEKLKNEEGVKDNQGNQGGTCE